MDARVLYAHALSPVHVGMGRGAGVIDLPVIREAVTNLPYLPGSGIKGVLRDACRDAGVDESTMIRMFGPEPKRPARDDAPEGTGGLPDQDAAGTASFTDLRLLFLPVRTGKGLFAWVTCPYVLTRWALDARHAGGTANVTGISVGEDGILLAETAKEALVTDGMVDLEDLCLTPEDDVPAEWDTVVETVARGSLDPGFHGFFTKHAGVVSDTAFGYLSRTATEIVARNRIEDDTKTVAEGALWWEEAVPSEAIFSGLVVATRRHTEGITGLVDILHQAIEPVLQIGGDASIGRGLVELSLDGGSK